MAFQLIPQLIFKWTDDNNDPAFGWKVTSYIAGTTTLVDTYSDDTGTVNDNPITLNARGEARIYLSSSVVYKFVITDPIGGNVQTFDNITGIGGINSGGGSPAGAVGDIQLNADGVNFGASGLNWAGGVLTIDNSGTGSFKQDYSDASKVTTTTSFDTGSVVQVVESGSASTTLTGSAGSLALVSDATRQSITMNNVSITSDAQAVFGNGISVGGGLALSNGDIDYTSGVFRFQEGGVTKGFNAVSISYDNTSSGLSATNVQNAIDEVNANSGVAGSNTEIQFNNNGAFGASSSLTFDGSALKVSGTNNEIRQEDGSGYKFSRFSNTTLREDVSLTNASIFNSYNATTAYESFENLAGSIGWSASGSTGNNPTLTWEIETPSSNEELRLSVYDDNSRMWLLADGGAQGIQLTTSTSGGEISSTYSGTDFKLSNNGTDSKLELNGAGTGENVSLDSRFGLYIGKGGFDVTGNSSLDGNLIIDGNIGSPTFADYTNAIYAKKGRFDSADPSNAPTDYMLYARNNNATSTQDAVSFGTAGLGKVLSVYSSNSANDDYTVNIVQDGLGGALVVDTDNGQSTTTNDHAITVLGRDQANQAVSAVKINGGGDASDFANALWANTTNGRYSIRASGGSYSSIYADNGITLGNNTTGTVDGTLRYTGSDAEVLKGGVWTSLTEVSTPAGSNTEIQFNNNGAFGASSSLTWNGSKLDVGGEISGDSLDIANDATVGDSLTIENSTNPYLQLRRGTATRNYDVKNDSGLFKVLTGIGNAVTSNVFQINGGTGDTDIFGDLDVTGVISGDGSGLTNLPSTGGFMDYNDTTGSISLSASTWTDVPNNGAGSFSNSSYPPAGVTDLLDTSTGYFDTSELDLGDTVLIRNDYEVNPSANNTLVKLRYSLGTGANVYTLEKIVGRLDSGSGIDYRFSLSPDLIYMGDTNTKDNPIKLQIWVSTPSTLTNAGSVIGVNKR